MKLINILTVLTLFGLLASCTMRNTSFPDVVDAGANWHVHDVQVIIPDSLTTSEENVFRPDVDIIWHGDPVGDRKKQVAVILHAALVEAVDDLFPENLHRPVVIRATLIHFHSLTPVARTYSGGVHKVSFSIEVVDQNTGEVLAGPTLIEADEFAYGGLLAAWASDQGDTMKSRIPERISEVTGTWLGLVAEQDAVRNSSIPAIGR